MNAKRKGYLVERKIRKLFEKNKYLVIRAGASLGVADLVCIKDGKLIFVQVKSTKKEKYYYYGYMKPKLAGFDFYVIVDFGKGNIVITKPKRIITKKEKKLEEFFN
ncbi:MAG: hypothetical protein QXX36_02240 [Candidatus Rehaiarchaeum fermentans]|nr:hypothetical protein [Candidatus Rehaiarchaeum fermentans]MCW1302420.1 hypothetical protein [Candidatus Rehaiarchaeum fermentans]